MNSIKFSANTKHSLRETEEFGERMSARHILNYIKFHVFRIKQVIQSKSNVHPKSFAKVIKYVEKRTKLFYSKIL